MEAAVDLALLAELIEPLFRFDDLFRRFALDVHRDRLLADLFADRDQVAPDRQIIDHPGIVASREYRDGSSGQPGQIGRSAEFGQSRIILQKRLQRHRRGQCILLDAPRRNLENTAVQGIEEMGFVHDRGDAVVNVVVDQQCAQQSLFRLDVVGQTM